MKPTVLVALILSLTAFGCSPSDDPASKPAAPAAPAAAAPAAASAPAADGDAFGASEKAFAGAKKACTGCPNPKICEEALTTALRLSAAALQETQSGRDRLDERAQRSEAVKAQFDGLAELSKECLAKME